MHLFGSAETKFMGNFLNTETVKVREQRATQASAGGEHWLTGGHWASLSAATSWTFRCLLWDFPLDLTSLCRTWMKEQKRTQRNQKYLSFG